MHKASICTKWTTESNMLLRSMILSIQMFYPTIWSWSKHLNTLTHFSNIKFAWKDSAPNPYQRSLSVCMYTCVCVCVCVLFKNPLSWSWFILFEVPSVLNVGHHFVFKPSLSRHPHPHLNWCFEKCRPTFREKPMSWKLKQLRNFYNGLVNVCKILS